ncbi:hypothetical protein E1A91_D13G072300v1 [Gossypium mustelinum]|uniref:Uncharacterized protein n=1 Tax=Gossypium mustelinum TaxID=34275 RepID=A0A5D2RZ09_GOSMU|nr:hypothetical protein E1A91_D13G072300v1 [Gossypium mustelinum]
MEGMPSTISFFAPPSSNLIPSSFYRLLFSFVGTQKLVFPRLGLSRRNIHTHAFIIDHKINRIRWFIRPSANLFCRSSSIIACRSHLLFA